MSKKGTKALASATLMSLVLTTALSAGPVKAATGQVTRLGAADRYATAAQVATSNWTTSDNVVLVSGEGYADAVSATALAKKLNAPILLTTAGSLSTDAANALTTLKAKNIYVVGGNASVSQAIRNQLKANYTLVELGGANRYETNAKVAAKLVELGVDPSNVMMVGGAGFSDALSVAPIASAKGQILLLGTNDAASMKSVIDFVTANKSKVTVVGTKNVISDAILSAVNGTRIDGGQDRFDTNLKVLAAFKDSVKADKLYVANASGDGYADALVASALAGKSAAPLVLVDSETATATSNALNYIKGVATKATDLNVVGGAGVVTNATVDAINNAVTPVVVTPGNGNAAVQSISTVGLNQVKVVFSAPVDKDSAITLSNYQFNGVGLDQILAGPGSGAKVSLSSDKLTATITFTTNEPQFKDITVTVKDSIFDKDLNNTISKFEQKVTFSDSAVPTVTSASVSGNSKVTVKFSEPVKLTNTAVNGFKINGQSISNYGLSSYSLKNADASNTWADGVDLYFATPLPVGSDTIKVQDGTSTGDLSSAANFLVKATTLNFTVDSVTDKPVVTGITGDTNGKIDITFNRAMDKATALVPGNYSINGTPIVAAADANHDGIADNIKFVDGSNDTQVEIKSVAGVNKGGNALLVSNNIKDAYGNKVADDTNVSFNATEDETKPTVTSVNVVDSETIRVKFSKDVNSTYATNTSNYEVKDSDGSTVAINGIVATSAGSNDSYDLKFTGANVLTGSKYTLTIKNIIDTATTPNTMDNYTTTVAGKDDVAPSISGVVQKSGSSTKVVVFFSEAMDEGTITDASNYYIVNGKTENKDLPAGTTITPAGDDKSVTLEFPSSYTLNTATGLDNDVVQVGVANVKDQAGNVLAGIAVPTTISKVYNVGGPVFTADTAKLYYDGNDVKAEIQLSTQLDKLVAADFTVAGQPADSAYLNGKTVVLVFKDSTPNTKINAIKAAGVGTAAIATVANPSSADAAGRTLAANVAGQVAYYYQLAPKTVSGSWAATAPLAGADTITIAFDEAIDGNIAGSYDDDFVFTVNGAKITPTTQTVVGGNTIVYQFANGTFAPTNVINVYANPDTSKIDVRTAKDGNGDYTTYAPSSDDLKVRQVTAQ